LLLIADFHLPADVNATGRHLCTEGERERREQTEARTE